jgi:hypothetical protein
MKKLLRTGEKGVVLEMPPNDDHRVRPHDVDHGIPAELRKMIGADNGVVVSAPNIVHARFKLDHILDTRSISRRPIHSASDAAPWESFHAPGRSRHLFECCQHPVLIETSISQIDFGIDQDLKLSALLTGGCVDTRPGQALKMVVARLGIDYVYGLVSTRQAFPNEGKQDAILFFVVGEKGADVAHFTELRTGQRDWLRRSVHSQVLPQEVVSRTARITGAGEYSQHKRLAYQRFTAHR